MNDKRDSDSPQRLSPVVSGDWFDKSLVLGALDSLGMALIDHHHQWTDGERAIYEEAIATLTCRDRIAQAGQ